MENRNDMVDWNSVSEDYQRVFKLGLNDYNREFMRFVTAEEMLPKGGSVLDIGCGVGKYGSYFAEMGHSVALTDISEKMIAFADENMSKYRVPWKSLVCDFDLVSGNEQFFAGGFDLVISTMSPAIHDIGTVKKMSAMSRGWCLVARFVSWEQPFREGLFRQLQIEECDKKMGSPDELIACVNAAGYKAYTKTVPYNWSDLRTPEEMAEHLLLGPLHEAADPDAYRKAVIDYCLRHADKDGKISDGVNTQVVWIYWDTNEPVPTKKLFDGAADFHGHRCPGLAMGVRAGYEALRVLGVSREDRRLKCTAESNACYIDGIQFAAGTTLGNKSIEIRDNGLAEFGFVDRETGKRAHLRYIAEPPDGAGNEEKINFILTAAAERVYDIAVSRSVE